MTTPELRAGPSGPLALVTDFDNLIWVNPIAALGGNGSVLNPFRTPAEALASMPLDSVATFVLSPGDYSATLPLVITRRNVNIICLGGKDVGGLAVPAKALLPNITFTGTTSMVFYCQNCNIPLATVSTTAGATVVATLDGCSSVWADAGGLGTVRATSNRLGFGVQPQQTISGTIAQSILIGMLINGALSGVNCISEDGRLGAFAVTMTNSAAFFTHEYTAGGSVVAPSIFLDQWSWFQALELAITLTSSAELSVQELSPIQLQWGAFVYANNNYLNPWANFGTAQASSAGEFIAAERKQYAYSIHAQIAATFAETKTFTLHTATTIAGMNAGATALTVGIPAGQLFAHFELPQPITIPQGNFMAIRGTFVTNVGAGPSCQVRVSCF